jgi:hypothetical protein
MDGNGGPRSVTAALNWDDIVMMDGSSCATIIGIHGGLDDPDAYRRAVPWGASLHPVCGIEH